MKTLPLSLMASLLLGLVACSASAPKKEEPPPTSQIIEHQENLKTEPEKARIVDVDSKVANTVNSIVVNEIRTKTINNRLVVNFELLNDRGRRDVIRYRMKWLDANGLMVAQYDPWETVALEGKQGLTVTLSSPTPLATDFRIEMQSLE